MKRLALFLFLLPLLAASLRAADVIVDVGGTSVTVPTPEGFVVATKEMSGLDRILATLVSPQNTRFAFFFPEELLPMIQRGEFPEMPRNLRVEATRQAVTGTFTTTDFTDLKDTVRHENAEMVRKVEKELPGLVDQANRNIKDKLNVDLVMKIGGVVPFPPHAESERSMAFSMLAHYSMKDAAGRTVEGVGYITTTFILVKAKLLFLYANGNEQDLEWTRQISKLWAESMLAANPSDPATEAKEAAGPTRHFDWRRVGTGALIGGVAGAVYGLARMLFRKKSGS